MLRFEALALGTLIVGMVVVVVFGAAAQEDSQVESAQAVMALMAPDATVHILPGPGPIEIWRMENGLIVEGWCDQVTFDRLQALPFDATTPEMIIHPVPHAGVNILRAIGSHIVEAWVSTP